MELEVKGKTILAVVAHADDLDFGCAGSIALWANNGASINYLILTDGSKGSEDMKISSNQLVKMRQAEQLQAGKILGIKEIKFAGFIDGELINSPEVRKVIVRRIRELKPDIVISNDPTFVYRTDPGFINHPDHRVAGQATLDCVFPFARNSRTFPELLKEGLQPHIVHEVLLTNFGEGNFFVDISGFMDHKLRALKAHISQMTDFKAAEQIIKERAKLTGSKIGAEYAESFTRIHLNR
jgi:LmbE family N-acetylglucosaminyl deacetylase